MSDSTYERREPGQGNSIKDVIASLGAGESSRKRKDSFHEVLVRMHKEYPALLEKYADKWVAIGREGVLAVADSMEEVFAEVESAGLRGSEFEVEFLDSNPPDLVL